LVNDDVSHVDMIKSNLERGSIALN